MSEPREPRIPPLPVEEWTDTEREALRAYIGDAGVERFLGGAPDAPRLPNVLGTLIRHPALAARWLPYNDVLLRTGTLDPRLRELVILRVAWSTGSEYEWVQHVRLGRGLGITDGEIGAIIGAGGHEWTALESDLLAAADELLDRTCVTDATWARLAAQLDQVQLMELVFVVGTYTCLSMAFQTFGIALDPELVDYPAPRVPERED